MLRRAEWHWTTALLMLVAMVVLAPLAWADTKQPLDLPIGILPTKPGQPPRPWLIRVDPSGVSGEAYVGVKITVTAHPLLGPTTRERTLRVVVQTNSWGGGYFDESVTDYITVPEGAASATHVVNVPVRRTLNSLYVEFFEDGERLEGCGANVGMTRSGYRNDGSDNVGVLLIDRDAPTRDEYRSLMTTIGSSTNPRKGKHDLPDIRWLVGAVPTNAIASNGESLANYSTETRDDAQFLQTFEKHEGVDVIPPSELAESWLSTSSVDLAIISHDDLGLFAQSPERLEALTRWAMAGGSLVIYEVGEEWEGLPAISRLLRLPEGEALPDDEDSPWRLPAVANFSRAVNGIFDQNTQIVYDVNGNPIAPSTGPDRNDPAPSANHLPFAYRRYGLGTIVAYRGNPFPGKPIDWRGLWNTIGSQQFLWTRRHGMSHTMENRDFWNFVVPGVGQAPVFSFMTMIALFMLAIGPINYYYLNRWKRLSLLLITVPIGAGIFTLGLFAFALLSDGFYTRARLRSYTVLEPGGRAACMSRQTYYTAFVPSEGMKYPKDTAVYPLHHRPYSEAANGYLYQGQSHWLDGELQLKQRYLTTREHRQFMVVRSTDCQAHLQVKPSTKSLAVKNGLGVALERAIFIDGNHKVYSIDRLEAGEAGQATPIDVMTARREWAKLVSAKTPAMPEHFDPDRVDNVFNMQYRYGWNGNAWGPTQNVSKLETGIGEADRLLLQLEGEPGDANRRTFFAITTEPVPAADGRAMAPLGISGSRIVESLHVVKGRW